jgi:hypothetical protein
MAKKKIKKYSGGGVAKLKANLETESGMQAAGLLGAGLGMGVGAIAAPKNKELQQSKYTNQLKDPDQNAGKTIGTTVGAGIGMVNPLLGAIATPLLSGIGGAIQGGLQKNKLKQIKTDTDRLEASEQFNEGISNQGIQMAKQYKKGGEASQEIIEIEGKKMPEIHTDKNFNLKNLGSTPHSKGGDKVLAEDGDVIFPTQNSPKKFNKVMKALKEKDIPSLKREQAKLPKDGGKKFKEGGTFWEKIKKINEGAKKDWETRPRMNYAGAGLKGEKITPGTTYPAGNPTKAATKQTTEEVEVQKEKTASGEVPGTVTASFGGRLNNPYEPAMAGMRSKDPIIPVPLSNGKTVDVKSTGGKTQNKKDDSKGGSVRGGKTNQPKLSFTPTKDNTISDLSGMNTKEQDEKVKEQQQDSRVSNAKQLLGKDSLSNRIAQQASKEEEVKKVKDAIAQSGEGKDPLTNHINNALELAPAMYNLGQGLFGKTETVERNFLTPDKLKYNDMSASLRRDSAILQSMGQSNARNASGGSIANMRSNMQQAGNEKNIRDTQINNQEIARQDQINNQNTEITNQAKGVNLQLKNQYDEADAMNRAKKGEALSKGLDGLGQIGTRNKLEKNEREAQKRELEFYAKAGPYKFNFDKDSNATGTVFNESKLVPTTAQLQTTNKQGQAVQETDNTTSKKKTEGKKKKSIFNIRNNSRS